MGLSQALFNDNRFAEGEKKALELIQRDRSFSAIYDVLYVQYQATKRLDDAERILQAKVESSPKRPEFILELANHYLQTGRAAESNAAIQKLTANTAVPKAHLLAGEFFARHSRWSDAIREFDAGSRSDQKNKASYQMGTVNVLRAQGKTAEALVLAESIVKEDSKNQDARALRATLLYESRNPANLDLALSEMQALVGQRPADALLHYQLGQIYLQTKKTDMARARFQEAVRLRPDFLAAEVALAALYLNQEKPHDALVIAKRLVDSDAANEATRVLYANALRATGDYKEARVQLAQALEKSPDNRDARLQLGMVAFAQKRFDEAERVFRQLHDQHRDDERAAIGLVETYAAQEQFDRAIKLLRDDLHASPKSTQLRELLARTSARAGYDDIASTEYRQLADLYPKLAEPRVRLAQIAGRKGNTGEAVKWMEEAVQVEPDNTAALGYLAALLLHTGRPDQAAVRYRHLLKLQPDIPAVLNDLAYAITESSGNLEEASELIRRAIEKTPESNAFKDTLGWIYFKKNDVNSALQVFESLVRRDPENASFRHHLGATLMKKGDRTRAQRELHLALNSKPSPIELARIRELLESR
jgi:Flp pilus assembly protein TadD